MLKIDNDIKPLGINDILPLLFFLIRIRKENNTMKYYRFLNLNNIPHVLVSLLRLIISSKFHLVSDKIVGFHHLLLILTTNQKKKVIGMCHFTIKKNICNTCWVGIVISDYYAGKGLGNKFLWDSIQYIRKLGFHEVILQVDGDNVRAYSLYKKIGFIFTSEQKTLDYRNHVLESFNEISMVLKL
jgi:ribosomal protein S18 acetylase RimI-like enzyme